MSLLEARNQAAAAKLGGCQAEVGQPICLPSDCATIPGRQIARPAPLQILRKPVSRLLHWGARGVLVAALAATAWAGTFGRVVPIGGHASDIALDERRGVLYIANFTAGRIEVMNLSDLTIPRSINVNANPGQISLSRNGRYLAITHYGNNETPGLPNNAVTVLDLDGNLRQTFVMGYAPLGIAFGNDPQGRALIVTTNDFELLDPATGNFRVLDTFKGLSAKTLPVGQPNFPPQIVTTSIGVSGDGNKVFGLTDTIEFSYNAQTLELAAFGYVSSPTQGPRVVSVNTDGSFYISGWAHVDSRRGFLLNEFPNVLGALNIGTHVWDDRRGLIYAQIPEQVITTPAAPGAPPVVAPAQAPVLQILDSDNLTVRDKLRLPENLGGRSLLSSDGENVYGISDSGVLVMPVGSLARQRRVVTSQESMVFRTNLCDRRPVIQELRIEDPGGNRTDFSLSGTIPGVNYSPAVGVTPATVRFTFDPSALQNQKGTLTGTLQVRSLAAVNITPDVRITVNGREADQRGTFVNVPGKLVDLVSDPVRDRFYVLRQDTNSVFVYDGTTFAQIGTMRTGNVPTQMAITFDGQYMLIGANDAQFIWVYNLDTLQQEPGIAMPGGHYPRSIAASGRAILVASRVAGPVHQISRVDMGTRTATAYAALGVYKNDISINTNLIASPNGRYIMGAMADGRVLLYDASADAFAVSRKDFDKLSGAYAASSNDTFLVDNVLMNSSLVPLRTLDSGSGASSGFAFVDDYALRSTISSATAPGILQRVDLLRGAGVRPTRMAEAPLTGNTTYAFSRTLAALSNRNSIISLTQSGFTVLPWAYDAAVPIPSIDRIVNAADQGQPVAPGGLISLIGRDLSLTNIATQEVPRPTALGESCITVNGISMPLILVSSTQVNAQLPFNVNGRGQFVLRTPGGVSDTVFKEISTTAPSVFRLAGSGTVIREQNAELVSEANPVRGGDNLVIYATGLGVTSPAIDAGMPAPSDTLALAVTRPEVSLNGVPLSVNYAGLAPGEVGIYQINVSVPGGLQAGANVPLTIRQGSTDTTLNVNVTE